VVTFLSQLVLPSLIRNGFADAKQRTERSQRALILDVAKNPLPRFKKNGLDTHGPVRTPTLIFLRPFLPELFPALIQQRSSSFWKKSHKTGLDRYRFGQLDRGGSHF
jgi:hypothetical protein